MKIITACPLDCPDSCSLEVTVELGKIVDIDAAPIGEEANPLTAGWICKKVKHHALRVYSKERIMTPLIRAGAKGSGQFRSATWDEAITLVASKISGAISEYGPDSVLPYLYNSSSARIDKKRLMPHLFERLGCPEIEHTICAGTSAAAWERVFGDMLSSDPMDLVHSKLIVVWGANPGASNTHLQPIITQAKKNGAVVVVIDPRRISAADRADLHIALRPGTDVVFGYAVARWINEHNRVDNNFVAEHVTGAEQFLLAANEWTLERASEICGVTVADIERFAELVTTIKPATLRVGLGMERNRNGGSAYLAAFGMWALTGNFGTVGSGIYGSTSGGFPNSVFAQWPQGVARPAQKKMNMNRVGRVLRGEPGAWHVPAKVLVIQGANPAVTAVDQQGMLEGLANEDVFVVLHEQVMTDTALLADVVLPATTHFEIHDVIGSYGAYVVQENRRVIEPVGESRSNGELAEALAVALGFSADEFDASRQAIETLVSESMCGTTPVRPEGGTIQFRDVFPSLDDQRMRIWELDSDMPGPKYEQLVDQAHPLTLLTPSTSYTINSMFGDTLPPPAVLKLHPTDASMHGVVTGETVTMFNDRASIAVEVEVDASMRQGVCAMPKGLWRRSIASGLTANAFAPDTFSDLADGACFNDARVQIKKLATK